MNLNTIASPNCKVVRNCLIRKIRFKGFKNSKTYYAQNVPEFIVKSAKTPKTYQKSTIDMMNRTSVKPVAAKLRPNHK